MTGEFNPEDLAEQIKNLVDKHNIMIPFETHLPPQPHANKLSEARAVKPEPGSGDAVFAKPNGKRAAASAGPAKGKGKVAKNAKSAMSVLPSPAQASTNASRGGSNQKKRKNSVGKMSGDEGDSQEPGPKSAKGGGGSFGGSSAKVLRGTLTPVGSGAADVKAETGDEEEEENSAWDALLSVCAQMPRQKTKS